jgi:hypothetical protein
LERIRDLSNDLARELHRPVDPSDAARALADAIKQDIDVVLRALNRPPKR